MSRLHDKAADAGRAALAALIALESRDANTPITYGELLTQCQHALEATRAFVAELDAIRFKSRKQREELGRARSAQRQLEDVIAGINAGGVA